MSVAKNDMLPPSWREIKSRKKHLLAAPWIYGEWGCEWMAHWLSRWAFLDILDKMGRLTILIAAISWLVEMPHRAQTVRQTKIANAWSVLNTAQGKSGSGGREAAINALISERVSLNGIDLSYAYFDSFYSLAHQYLERAQFNGSYFEDCSFNNSTLFHAVLDDAEFVDTEFTSAILIYASCNNTVFNGDCSLAGVSFFESYCVGAEINAIVAGADFTGADLRNTKLKGLRHWRQIKSIQYANIAGVVNAPEGFVEWAQQNGAVSYHDANEWLNHLDAVGYNKDDGAGTYWLRRHYE